MAQDATRIVTAAVLGLMAACFADPPDVGTTTAGSTGPEVPVPDCGFRWCGVADGAHGIDDQMAWAPIFIEGTSNPVEGCVCMTEDAHDALTTGLAFDCDTFTTDTTCNSQANCTWHTNALGSGVDLCVPTTSGWFGAWETVVTATKEACEDEATQQGFVELYPDCASIQGGGACNGTTGCTWGGGAGCLVDGLTCPTAAISTPIFDDETTCPLMSDECPESDTSGGFSGPWGVDPREEIFCHTSTQCEVTPALLNAVANDPYPMLDDDVRATLDEVGGFTGFVITGINVQQPTGELAFLLQLEDDDLVFEVNGMPLSSELDLLSAVDQVLADSFAIVKLRRDGATVTITYTHPLTFDE
jgi:hypothetical protein